MRTIILTILSLTLAAAEAPDKPRKLDPTVPLDAVLILDQVTIQMQMTREQALAVTQALQTLLKEVQPKEPVKVEKKDK